MDIHTIILKHRLEKGLNQSNMAFKLKITQKSYSEIESGKTKLKFNDFIKIASILEIHPCDLASEIITNQCLCKMARKINAHQDTIHELNTKIKILEKTIELQSEIISIKNGTLQV
jgi:DNA-binding XRE family transcriptional regulator